MQRDKKREIDQKEYGKISEKGVEEGVQTRVNRKSIISKDECKVNVC